MPITLGSSLRSQFPIFQNKGDLFPFAYLDTAVSAQKPRCVIEAMTKHMEQDYGSVHRGAYGTSVRSSLQYEEVRQKIARFLSPHSSEFYVVFTKNATEGLNLIANGIAESFLQQESRIVLPTSEHHANFVPWQQAALKKDCQIAYIPLCGKQGKDLQLNLSEAEKLINSKTKVVAFAFVGNVLGQINPVAEMVHMAKKVGAWVVVDCAQSASCLEDDLFALGVDALVLSGHKIYGPSGVSVLAMRKTLAEQIPPLLYGGGMVSSVTLEGAQFLGAPAKFEAGTPPITEVMGLGAAIDWLEAIGRKNLHAHTSNLNSLFVEKLRSFSHVDIYSPMTGQETLVSFQHRFLHAHDLSTIFDNHNVAVRAGHHCAWPLVQFLGVDSLVRVSFGAYSDVDHVEQAIEALRSAEKYASK